ncbi:MAG: hypothetical protein ACI808_002648 [Paraglaciecola sp.]|jgi:hypothetical protein
MLAQYYIHASDGSDSVESMCHKNNRHFLSALIYTNFLAYLKSHVIFGSFRRSRD